MVLEKTVESPLDCKEIQPVHSEGDQPWDPDLGLLLSIGDWERRRGGGSAWDCQEAEPEGQDPVLPEGQVVGQ